MYKKKVELIEKKLKRVAFVINKVELSGGAERVMCTLASEFSRRGIESNIFTQQTDKCGYPLDESVKIIPAKTSLKIPVLRNLVRNVRMRKNIKKFNPDVIISFLTVMNVQSILFAFGLKSKVIVSERVYPGLVKQPYKFLSKILYPFADGFVFQTKEAKACFKGKINKRSTIIPNPIASGFPDAKGATSDKYIVTMGRITKQKNHELLIRAFAEFYKNHPDYCLKIYGNGPLKEELQNLSQELGVGEAVKFMGAVKNVANYIVDASMFVFTSDYEGMPNALAEAMAMGLPCISTDCVGGGASALIQDGKNGFLIKRGDFKALIYYMEKIANDENLAKNLAIEAKKVRETFSVKKITERWIDYAQSVLQK